MKIPKDWSEVTLQKYEDAYEWLTSEPNYVRKWIGAVASLTGESYDYVSKEVKFGELNSIINQLHWIAEYPSDQFVNEFEMNGKKYVVNPDIRKVSASQFVKMCDILENKSNNWRAAFTALFVAEKGKDPDINEHTELTDLIHNKCPFNVIYPLSVFFYRLMNDSYPYIEDYFQRNLIQMNQNLTKLMMELKQEMSEVKIK